MNEYFCSIGEKLAADIVHTSNPLLSREISIIGGGRIFDFRKINERDIRGAMFRMKVKKSFGNDNISGYFLKIALPYICRILMLIFNTSIEKVVFLLAGRLLEFPQFKKVRSQKSQIIDQYQCYLFYLDCSRNLSMTSCINTQNGVGS